jgi:hypothetical protein
VERRLRLIVRIHEPVTPATRLGTIASEKLKRRPAWT